MFRIVVNKEMTKFYPQREGWVFWWSYSTRTLFGSKIVTSNVEDALKIIADDEKRRAEGWKINNVIKWVFLTTTVVGVILLLLRSKGMI